MDELQRIDREAIDLLRRRESVMAKWSAESPGNLPTFWQLQSASLAAIQDLTSDSKLDREAVSAWLKNIVSLCQAAIGTRPKVAYLGPMYSYSYLAAIKHFGEAANLVPVGTIPAVFDEIASGHSAYGVVPIENSTDGRIVDTLGMFAKLPVHICGEVNLPIHHYLLGRCSRADVVEVYSKPQALSQCRGWLAAHLPQAKVLEMDSTAAAAKLAAEKLGVAAIASREAGVHHGLNVIDANIEDNTANLTRFAIIGNDPAPPTQRDKTSLMFQVPHQPGALAGAMTIFHTAGLNLTWIESFPLPGRPSEYLFFVELEGHQADTAVGKAIGELEKSAIRLEILGSYPKCMAATQPATAI